MVMINIEKRNQFLEKRDFKFLREFAPNIGLWKEILYDQLCGYERNYLITNVSQGLGQYVSIITAYTEQEAIDLFMKNHSPTFRIQEIKELKFILDRLTNN